MFAIDAHDKVARDGKETSVMVDYLALPQERTRTAVANPPARGEARFSVWSAGSAGGVYLLMVNTDRATGLPMAVCSPYSRTTTIDLIRTPVPGGRPARTLGPHATMRRSLDHPAAGARRGDRQHR
jgi:hypothetical protein